MPTVFLYTLDGIFLIELFSLTFKTDSVSPMLFCSRKSLTLTRHKQACELRPEWVRAVVFLSGMSWMCVTQGRGLAPDSRIHQRFGGFWWISSLPCFVVRLFLCASVTPSLPSRSPGRLQWLVGEVWGGRGDRGRPQSQWQLQECRGRKQQGREVANRQEPHALRHLEAQQVSDSK